MIIELDDDLKDMRLEHCYDTFTVMSRILKRDSEVDMDREKVWVIGLAITLKIRYVELTSLGSMDAAFVTPMNIFRLGLMKGVHKLIMVHSHPGADLLPRDLLPSENDNSVTSRMIQVGNIIGIKVVEHMIISPDYFFSYDKTGLLKKLAKDKTWKPAYIEIQEIKEEMERIGIEKGLKKGLEKGLQRGLKKGLKKGHREGKKIVR